MTCHHTSGAVTGAIPGVSFAPLPSPFPKASTAALSPYAPLSEGFVPEVLFSVIGFGFFSLTPENGICKQGIIHKNLCQFMWRLQRTLLTVNLSSAA